MGNGLKVTSFFTSNGSNVTLLLNVSNLLTSEIYCIRHTPPTPPPPWIHQKPFAEENMRNSRG